MEFELNKSRETSDFNPPISVEGSWMIGLRSLEVYNFLFNINTTNIKFEFYTDTSDEFSFDEFKDKVEEILSISDITPSHLQHEIIGTRIIEAYNKLGFEKSSNDGNLILLMGYA